jgi:hypothetical protein
MQTSAGGASPDHVTGITGSHRSAGDPGGGGTLTQRQASLKHGMQTPLGYRSPLCVKRPHKRIGRCWKWHAGNVTGL